jgi:hypothetical protein
MRKPKNLGRQALNKRSGRPRLKACDAQNLGHNCPHAVGFPIRPQTDSSGNAQLQDIQIKEFDISN